MLKTLYSHFFILNNCTFTTHKEKPGVSTCYVLPALHIFSFQSDLIYQSIYELIHKDDRAAFHCQLHRGECWAGKCGLSLSHPQRGPTPTSGPAVHPWEPLVTSRCRFPAALQCPSRSVRCGFIFHLFFPAVPDGCSVAGSPNHQCPECSGCMERNFTCRLRCLLANSLGFLVMPGCL